MIHITGGPRCVTATALDHRETRWCFGCRRHLPHTWNMIWDGPERQPTYYDPIPVIRCSRCGNDLTAFPGSYVEGPHYPENVVTWELLCRGHSATTGAWDWDVIWERDRRSREEWSA